MTNVCAKCKLHTAQKLCLLEYLNQNLTSCTTPTVISPFYNCMRYTVINHFLLQKGPIIFWLNFHLLFSRSVPLICFSSFYFVFFTVLLTPCHPFSFQTFIYLSKSSKMINFSFSNSTFQSY